MLINDAVNMNLPLGLMKEDESQTYIVSLPAFAYSGY